MPCLNSPFVLMSVFEEFVSRMLYMHFYTGGGGISLPEAHHAAARVMQAITSRERSSENSQFFSYFCVINHLKLSFFFYPIKNSQHLILQITFYVPEFT